MLASLISWCFPNRHYHSARGSIHSFVASNAEGIPYEYYIYIYIQNTKQIILYHSPRRRPPLPQPAEPAYSKQEASRDGWYRVQCTTDTSSTFASYHFRTLFMVGTIRRREKLSCDVLPRSIRLDWLRLTILELSQLVLLLEGWEDPSIHQYVTRDPSMPLSTRWRIYFEKLHPILHHDATVWCGSIRILFYHHPRRPSSTPSSYSGSCSRTLLAISIQSVVRCLRCFEFGRIYYTPS